MSIALNLPALKKPKGTDLPPQNEFSLMLDWSLKKGPEIKSTL